MFARAAAGKLELDRTVFDLRETVTETLELLVEGAQRKGVELMCLVADDVPAAVQGDPTRLRQILTNLLGNAIKFTAQGEVVVRVTTLAQDAETVRLRCEICDTGIGIAPEDQARLFQPFSQVDGSTTRKYGGTGLGLSIAKELAHLMGGTIGVKSTVGTGSTFWFGVCLGIASAKAPPKTVSCALQGRRVLLVAANATHRAILGQQVSACGMCYESASHGSQALEMLRAPAVQRAPYSVVILERQLPGMDGLGLARAIQADATIAAVPVIMLTPVGLLDEGDDARPAGIAAMLNKPVRQSRLYDCLLSVLQAPGTTPAVSSSAAPDVETAAVFEQVHILLADDNAINQQVAFEMLTGFGCRVQVVATGREALEALERGTYDLVLMDCQMPDMDGFAATRVIRQREAARAQAPLPIIAMTAHAMRGDEADCLAAGMSDYLSKPFSEGQLHAILRRWLPLQEDAGALASLA